MRRTSLVIAALVASPTLAEQHIMADCRATPQIFSGTTLSRLADNYFGDVDYRYAILLATNARVGQGFPFIGNPNALPVGQELCVPHLGEAETEKNRFLTYEEAVGDMSLPYPSEVSKNLDPIDITQPVTVVSWVRADQAADWQDKLGTTLQINHQTWVTAAPHLQEFCTEHVDQRGPNPAALTLRLEQRLGLAPNSAKTHFVEFEIANPGDSTQIFRPCVDTDVTTNTCAFKSLPNCTKIAAGEREACEVNYAFFTSQYYHSYGVTLPTEFPWTSLGYTFDWAHEPIGQHDRPDFVQFGESEYVIPPTGTVTVKTVTPTSDYCAPG